MSEPIDPAAIMAEHHPPRLDPDGEQDCMGADYDCPYIWPCPTYRLAEALLAEQAKVARVEELAHRFELIPRARLLGAITARPKL